MVCKRLLKVLEISFQNYTSSILHQDVLNKVKLILEENDKPLKRFSTEHLRFKMYQKRSCFTNPEPYKIGDDNIFIIKTFTEITVKYVLVHGVSILLTSRRPASPL